MAIISFAQVSVVIDFIPNCRRAYCYTKQNTIIIMCRAVGGVVCTSTVSRCRDTRSNGDVPPTTNRRNISVPTSGAIVAALAVLQQYSIPVIAPEATTYSTTCRLAIFAIRYPNIVCPFKVYDQHLMLLVKCITSKWCGGAARSSFCMDSTSSAGAYLLLPMLDIYAYNFEERYPKAIVERQQRRGVRNHLD